MISKVELEDIFKKEGLNIFEIDISIDNPCMIYFKNNDISELINFAKANSIQTLLYCYDFNSKDNYQITDDMLEEYDERIIKAIHREVEEYNQLTSTLNYLRPSELYIYCVYQGCLFTVSEEDTWLEDMGILMSNEKLEEMISTKDTIWEEIDAEEQNKKEELIIHLKEYLRKDEMFLNCTNQRLRINFIMQFLKENVQYKQCFSGYYEPVAFVELIWRELKASKNKQ